MPLEVVLEQSASTLVMKGECLGVVWVVMHFKPYLIGGEVPKNII